MKIRCLISVMILLGIAGTLDAQTTSFNYQGSLNSGGTAANGNHDFEFALFDALAGGSQLGTTLTRSSVAVSKGVFSVSLDFGNQFPGAARFLEIRVRQTGGGAFTPLSPRQPINSMPYAVKSVNADNATTAATASNALQLGGVAASQYVITADPRMSDARPPTAGSADYIQNQNTGAQAASNFNISGTGTANIFSAATQYNIGSTRVLSFGLGTFVGVRAGNSNTGTGNSFVGRSAGDTNGSGFNNSFFGHNAGVVNETGSQNSFFGNSTGAANTTANNNSFFGFDAGRPTTTGGGNSFFGRAAGFSNQTGTKNTAIGDLADVGSGNLSFATAIGAGAVVSASNTVSIGRLSDTVQVPGSLNVSGSLSTAIVNATTQYNIGGLKMLSASGPFIDSVNGINVTASNTFAGERAGSSTTPDPSTTSPIGKSNTFIGADAGRNNTTGQANSFLGFRSGAQNTIGNTNSFFGVLSGSLNTTSNANAFFGHSSGGSNTSGGGNSFFGTLAGTGNTTGTQNIAIGRSANVLASNLHNATAIGSFAGVSQSNSIVLGSINGVNGAFDSVSVGIGTTAPARPLHVANGSAGSITPNANTLVVLERSGNTYIQMFSPDTDESGLLFGRPSLNIKAALIASPTDGLQFRAGGNTTRMTLDAGGNFGIGTASPTERLHVAGDGRFTGALFVVGNLNALFNLNVSGSLNVNQNANVTGNLTVGAFQSGATSVCRTSGGILANCSSSARYKTNVERFSAGLDMINKLRPVSFNWKDGGMLDVGLIAEEVAKIEPLLATINDKGEIEGVKYDRVGVVLVNAVKEQQTQIEGQQKQIDEQKAMIKQQQELLAGQQAEIKKQRAEFEALKRLVCSNDQQAELCRTN